MITESVGEHGDRVVLGVNIAKAKAKNTISALCRLVNICAVAGSLRLIHSFFLFPVAHNFLAWSKNIWPLGWNNAIIRAMLFTFQGQHRQLGDEPAHVHNPGVRQVSHSH